MYASLTPLYIKTVRSRSERLYFVVQFLICENLITFFVCLVKGKTIDSNDMNRREGQDLCEGCERMPTTTLS